MAKPTGLEIVSELSRQGEEVGSHLRHCRSLRLSFFAYGRLSKVSGGTDPFSPQTTSGHGRVEERAVTLGEASPLATGFIGSRVIVRIASARTVKKTGQTSVEDRYYLSSQDAHERTPENWIELSRSHWAGVENRNHWRRDASLGEDRTRLHQRRALVNLALLRNANLRLLASDSDDRWLPAKKEYLAAYPSAALNLLRLQL